jgi:phosphoribosylformylglycinamidine synthase
MTLARRHAVECTVIGRYTDSGFLHITYDGQTCAYVDLKLLTAGFPQWEFDAWWSPPTRRNLYEPVIDPPRDYGPLLLDLLRRPNICSKAWISRQYDHEVQGSSVIKPLVGAARDVNSDAAVIRPVLTSEQGLAYAQALLPGYAAIDAYHMVAATIDEAVRRVVAVGGDWHQIGGVDNFCWPSIQYHPQRNPDGRFKAAQLVRACWALRDICLAYEIPLLSGKDSMYVDGHLPGAYGESHKISAPETLQFAASAVVADVNRCTTMDCKAPGDLVYILGATRDELGGSEYYDLWGYTGLNVPQVRSAETTTLYPLVQQAIAAEMLASVHGVYRGGLGIHLVLMALGGRLGMQVDLRRVPLEGPACQREDTILFSESAGRFIVTIEPDQQQAFETHFADVPRARIGVVDNSLRLKISDLAGQPLVDMAIEALLEAWQGPFAHLV